MLVNFVHTFNCFSCVDKLVVLSALRVEVPLNDIHDIYENTIMDKPRKLG